MKQLLVVALGVLVIASLTGHSNGVRLVAEESLIFELYKTNVYVVDMRKHPQPPRPLTLKCFSRPNAVDLRLSFTGLNSRTETVSLTSVDTIYEYPRCLADILVLFELISFHLT